MVTNLSGELRQPNYCPAYNNHADEVEFLTIYVSDTYRTNDTYEIEHKILEETTEYDIEMLKLHFNEAYPQSQIQDIKIFQDTKEIDYLQRKLQVNPLFM
jgi:hypothetical protein